MLVNRQSSPINRSDHERGERGGGRCKYGAEKASCHLRIKLAEVTETWAFCDEMMCDMFYAAQNSSCPSSKGLVIPGCGPCLWGAEGVGAGGRGTLLFS